MSDAVTLSEALRTPLPQLRGLWLETRCCCRQRSPLWFHAAKRPQDLLSDLAFEYSCPDCGVQPALALMGSEPNGEPSETWRLELCDAFEG